ncbi:flagellar protein FliO/FliZ [Scopulibacillus darangshiensis]|uniref:Flagellar protein FliO/FliZ n=1 Tax=Scopulibacillus darangshiensis TaxID=442528 RepID=A0A4R2P7R2_9BACL|nr:flagellar biosynthetic protein FliO [Scopulibacillus darangshiensis]TCP30318.1 flagellar protein FliO/FliZ [Scopulibacillus darangshiensis]
MLRKWIAAGGMLTIIFFCLQSITLAATSNDRNTVEDMFKKQSDHEKAYKGTKAVQSESVSDDQTSLFITFIKLIGALLIVLALIYLLYRLVSKRTKAYQDYGSMKNIGGVSVGANRSVQLVRVGQEVLVIGVGDNVQLLKEIKDPELVENLLNQEETGDPLQINMKKILSWTKGKAFMTQANQNQPSDFRMLLMQRLAETKKDRQTKIEALTRKDSSDE